MIRVMALVVFLRGVNVGGHRRFRPSILARELSDYDVVNVGAAGTFIVHKPGSRTEFRSALLRKLPFEAEVVLCDARDLVRLETENPFAAETSLFGMYRRHMKTISYLGQIDKLYGVPATTRNWNTIIAILRILRRQVSKGRCLPTLAVEFLTEK
jgi:uncharacterized protein (DUF1697 family)